jgi:hypothetical protein
MNNPNTTTRIFYVYRNSDKLRIPACLETSGSREDGIAILARDAAVVSVTPVLAGDALRAELADARGRLANLPNHRRLADLRYDLASYVGHLEREIVA